MGCVGAKSKRAEIKSGVWAEIINFSEKNILCRRLRPKKNEEERES